VREKAQILVPTGWLTISEYVKGIPVASFIENVGIVWNTPKTIKIRPQCDDIVINLEDTSRIHVARDSYVRCRTKLHNGNISKWGWQKGDLIEAGDVIGSDGTWREGTKYRLNDEQFTKFDVQYVTWLIYCATIRDYSDAIAKNGALASKHRRYKDLVDGRIGFTFRTKEFPDHVLFRLREIFTGLNVRREKRTDIPYRVIAALVDANVPYKNETAFFLGLDMDDMHTVMGELDFMDPYRKAKCYDTRQVYEAVQPYEIGVRAITGSGSGDPYQDVRLEVPSYLVRERAITPQRGKTTKWNHFIVSDVTRD
jgi:hypothetical protein